MNIVYTPTNDTYIFTLVSICSILLNNLNSDINFYLVIDDTFNKLEYFESIKKYKNCKNINVINVDKRKYRNLYSKFYFTTRLYAFEFANLIKEDKVLYLSSHTIVTGNIQEMYDTDISNFSAAATEFIYQKNIKKIFGIEKNIIFHNTVVLINLKNWRNENIYEKFVNKDFLNFINTNLLISDNECFNVLINKCKLLNFKYNYTESWYGEGKALSCSPETRLDYFKFNTHIEIPVIITMIGEQPLDKENINSYMGLWWKYAEQTPIYKEIKDYRQANKYKLQATSAQNSFKYSWLFLKISFI